MKTNIHVPFYTRDTEIFMADFAGGFSVRNCPNPQELAIFIARAVNSHDELLEACEAAFCALTDNATYLERFGNRPALEYLQDAIKKARGETCT